MNRIEKGATFFVVAFVIVRFAAVAGVLSQYGVNVWIFLALDVGTAPPYVKGMSMLLRNASGRFSLTHSLKWGSVAAGSFFAPYLYLYWAGKEEFPTSLSIGIGLIVALLAATSLARLRKQIKKGL